MHTRWVTSALLAGTLALAPAWAGAADPPLKRLVLVGGDGGEIYFVARCRDGRSASVVERAEPREVCASSLGGKRRCRKDWTLMEAAKHACTASLGR